MDIPETSQAEPGNNDLNRLGQPIILEDADDQTEESVLVSAAGTSHAVRTTLATPTGDKPEPGQASMD